VRAAEGFSGFVRRIDLARRVSSGDGRCLPADTPACEMELLATAVVTLRAASPSPTRLASRSARVRSQWRGAGRTGVQMEFGHEEKRCWIG
jgi:hypothetical protein